MTGQHDVVANYVAATRFPFPNQNKNPLEHGLWPKDYKTIVNVEKKERSLQINGKTWYPDIAVVNSKNEIRELGEVEDPTDVKPEVLEKWRKFASAASIGPKGYPKLFIYVPASKEAEALRMLNESGIRYAGLRAYQVTDAGGITIREIVTYDP